MGLDQSNLLLAPLTDHRNQLRRLSKMPSDERASSAPTAISLFHFANHRPMRIVNGTRCHKNVILIVVNDGKSRPEGAEGEQRRRKRFIGVSRNTLIFFD